MKRRQFLNGFAAAAISGAAVTGCNSDTQPKNAAVVTPTPVATPTPNCTGGDPKAICYKAQMLMIFMLAFSQKDFKTKVPFVNLIFPDSGIVDFPKHPFAQLGIDVEALKFFRQQLINGGFDPKDIMKSFNVVNLMFSQLVSYTGSECPSKTSLMTIIATAKAQQQ